MVSPGDLKLLPGAAVAIRALNDVGIRAIVVTNQRGIARGRMTEDDLVAIHQELADRLAAEAGARLDAIFYCPHDLDGCMCRKPQPGMLFQARARFPDISLPDSVMIGDAESDAEAGRNAGMQTVRLGTDVRDLTDAVDQLLTSVAAARQLIQEPGGR